MEEDRQQIWRIWVDTERKIVSFREEMGGQLLEFRSRDIFLHCVDEYTRLQYRFQ